MKTVLNDKRFFKDPQHAKVSGVCAGFAKYYDINVWLLRAVAIAGLVMIPMVTGIAYVLAVILLNDQ